MFTYDFSVETELEFLLRIILSIICGACIGFERETRLKTAGIRTHIIVSLGSALMMIISKYGFGDVLQSGNIGLDPSRIAAGIVTAVGFIGAGVIFVRNQTISGVTTAAGIWATVELVWQSAAECISSVLSQPFYWSSFSYCCTAITEY